MHFDDYGPSLSLSLVLKKKLEKQKTIVDSMDDLKPTRFLSKGLSLTVINLRELFAKLSLPKTQKQIRGVDAVRGKLTARNSLCGWEYGGIPV